MEGEMSEYECIHCGGIDTSMDHWRNCPKHPANEIVTLMLQALEAAEWGGPWGGMDITAVSFKRDYGSCPVCKLLERAGEHTPDCILAAALKKAREG